MKLAAAYRAVLLAAPPIGAGVVGILAGFLATALPGVKLARLGAGVEALGSGVAWGAALAGAALVGTGVILMGEREVGRWRAAAGLAAGGLVGAAAVLLGAAAGAWAGGQASAAEIGAALTEDGWTAAWVILAGASMAVAVAARKR